MRPQRLRTLPTHSLVKVTSFSTCHHISLPSNLTRDPPRTDPRRFEGPEYPRANPEYPRANPSTLGPTRVPSGQPEYPRAGSAWQGFDCPVAFPKGYSTSAGRQWLTH